MIVVREPNRTQPAQHTLTARSMTQHFGICSAYDFVIQVVKPAVCDALKYENLTEARCNFCAVMCLFHIVDWVFHDDFIPKDCILSSEVRNEKDFANHIVKNECGDFGLIRDVANSSKHVVRSRTSTTRTVTGRVLWGISHWEDLGFTDECFMIQIEPGIKERPLPMVLMFAFNYWSDFLRQTGFKVDNLPYPPYHTTNLHDSDPPSAL